MSDRDLFPKIEKNIADFINDEEASIPRSKLLAIGSMVFLMSVLLAQDIFAAHGSHSSHSSHKSHSSHVSHSSGSYTRSHSSHASHSNHSNHYNMPSAPSFKSPSTTRELEKGISKLSSVIDSSLAVSSSQTVKVHDVDMPNINIDD